MKEQRKVNVLLMALQSLVFLVLIALTLFLPAWTIRWPSGWLFLSLFFAFYLGISLWMLRHNPGLAQERTKLVSSDQKGWDKLLSPIMSLVAIVWMVFTSMDAARYHWSHVSFWVQCFGCALLLFSFSLLFVTFRENSYLSSVVRVQQDRGQTVICTGPYRYVRHPMYSAFLPFTVGASLLLGSWYGVLFSLPLMVVIGRRAVLEERTLLTELPGYNEYALRVRYRMVPFIW